MIVMTKHVPGRVKTGHSHEHTEKWTRDFRNQNDEEMGRNGRRERERRKTEKKGGRRGCREKMGDKSWVPSLRIQ